MKSRIYQPEFKDLISSSDIIVLSETKTDNVDVDELKAAFDKLGYSLTLSNRHKVANRRSGGIGIAIRKSIEQFIDIIRVNEDCVMWIKISTALTGYAKPTLLGGVYVSPEGSRYGSLDCFDDIEASLSSLLHINDYHVLLAGDFNAYTKCLDDFIPIDENQDEHDQLSDPLGILDSYEIYNTPNRVTQDEHRPNNYGHRLIDICKSQNLRIFNGRVGVDGQSGKCTSTGCSVIDYFIGSPFLMSQVEEFEVLTFDALLSDVHCPVVLSLRVKTDNSTTERIDEPAWVGQMPKGSSKEKIKGWDDEKASSFIDNVSKCDLSHVYDALDNNEDPNVANALLVSVLLDAARTTFGVVKPRRATQHKKSNEPWFNNDCRIKRSKYFRAKHAMNNAKKVNQTINHELENEFIQKSREYNRSMKSAKRVARKNWHKELRKMKFSNPKQYWKKVKGQTSKQCPIDVKSLYNHFKNINNSDHDTAGVPEANLDYETQGLNAAITEEEVICAIKALKNGKAVGIDEVRNEFIKHSSPLLISIYCKLFNKVLDSGIVPEQWVQGIIIPIYKGKGDTTQCDNYRGITLLSCVSKLFTSILNKRLTTFIDDNEILLANQAGFRKSHSTLDHCFVLKSLIDLFLHNKKRLYVAFIDFRKAFDSVWRSGLWEKLLSQNVDGKIFRIVTNLYSQIKSCVMNRETGERSNFFGSFSGVRQGENLSPLLFSLFVNDLEEFLKQNGCRPLELPVGNDGLTLTMYLKIFVLLYADDTVLLSETRDGLKQSLLALEMYCNQWKLSVNSEKTKIMIFQKRKRPRTNADVFQFDSRVLEIVDSFRYLGVEFSANINFNLAKKAAFDKASRAMFSLLQTARRQHLPIDVVMDLFDKMVIPILMYGSEIWGYESLALLEKLHIKALKFMLRLHKSTKTAMVYGESGRYPLSLLVRSRMVGFWADIVNNASKLSHRVYFLLRELFDSGTYISPWLSTIKNILVDAGLECVWTSNTFSSKDSLLHIIKSQLALQYREQWRNELDNSSKCLLYKNFKHDVALERNIVSLPESLAFVLLKFRCSNHKLPIEQGRKYNIERENRICQKCNMNSIGDEFHLIFECPSVQVERKMFIPPYFTHVKSTYNLCKLLECKSKKLSLNLAKFLKATKAV